MVNVGIVGYGYWGPNLVRNFSETSNARVVSVCDLSPERLAQVNQRYPKIQTTRSSKELIENPQIDAIVIATPVATHFDLAFKALQAGKHVLVEKPIAGTLHEAQRLVEEAQRRKKVLMVDHTFVYTGAVRKIKQLVEENKLGKLFYYDSVRVNLGLFQHDVSVLWDLAVHDLAIMDYIVGAKPTRVSATGSAHLKNHQINIAYLTCFFDDGLIAHFHVNWLAPVKIRRTLIGGDRQMIVYDDLEPDEKIRIYDKGADSLSVTEQVNYRVGDMWAPQLDRKEALATEMCHFIDCIANSKTPITDGEAGCRVVRVLEAASKSLEQDGTPIKLSWD